MNGWQVVTMITALASATAGGVFFSFSTFTMQGLAGLPDADGMAAMQSINRTAVRPPLMALLFGTATLCAVLAIRGVTTTEAGSWLLLAGGVLYLLGAVGVTVVKNVPLNNALADADPSDDRAALWRDYLRRWTRWNHVRTVSCILAAAVLVAAALG